MVRQHACSKSSGEQRNRKHRALQPVNGQGSRLQTLTEYMIVVRVIFVFSRVPFPSEQNERAGAPSNVKASAGEISLMQTQAAKCTGARRFGARLQGEWGNKCICVVSDFSHLCVKIS